MSDPTRPLSIVVAGGGTAGHIEPAMAVADALVEIDPTIKVTALGTARGLETTLVPERGYRLELIPPVPLPRKPNADLAKLPLRLRKSVAETRRVLDEVDADVVIGFGGYVALPAYLAARLRRRSGARIPVVIHEANARAGVANKVGARLAQRVLAAVPDSGLDAEVVGIPVRAAISDLDRGALRSQARAFFGLDPDAPTLLVFGGSQGAGSLNTAVRGAAQALCDSGIGVLHAYGKKNSLEPFDAAPAYVGLPYISRMDLAYAAADLAVCRSGAMTVAEVSATGLPAVYVPLPHGNGEQRLNAAALVAAGGGLLVDDADLTPDYVAQAIPPLLTDPQRLAAMAAAAAGSGARGAAQAVAAAGIELARAHRTAASR
ncbi:UNVERIFIED_CONTAM: UDP-N-acetylglucosamine-N-acetylmuramylpentapeptide N-acetylglucosamine transferase [Williamsia faeni]